MGGSVRRGNARESLGLLRRLAMAVLLSGWTCLFVSAMRGARITRIVRAVRPATPRSSAESDPADNDLGSGPFCMGCHGHAEFPRGRSLSVASELIGPTTTHACA